MTRVHPDMHRPLPARISIVWHLAVWPWIIGFVAAVLALAIAAWPHPAHATNGGAIQQDNGTGIVAVLRD